MSPQFPEIEKNIHNYGTVHARSPLVHYYDTNTLIMHKLFQSIVLCITNPFREEEPLRQSRVLTIIIILCIMLGLGGEYRVTESMPPRHHEHIHAMGFACLNQRVRSMNNLCLNTLRSHINTIRKTTT